MNEDHYATTWRELWQHIRQSPTKQRNAAILLLAAALPVATTITMLTLAFG